MGILADLKYVITKLPHAFTLVPTITLFVKAAHRTQFADPTLANSRIHKVETIQ